MIKTKSFSFSPHTSYDDLIIENLNFPSLVADDIHINGGSFKKIDFSGSKLNRLKFFDISISDSNLSNLLSYNPELNHVTIQNSKLTGLRFMDSVFDTCLISNSQSQYLQIRFGRCSNLFFDHCDLRGSDFTGTDLSTCRFNDCDLSDSEFSGVKLTGTDIRRSIIDNIRLGTNEIKGVIVTTAQALYLSGLLDIDIRD